LLVFWSLFLRHLPATSCRSSSRSKPKYTEKVQIVTVNLDEGPRAKTVKGFAEAAGVHLPDAAQTRLTGGTSLIDQTYKVKAEPALYLVKRDGTIAFGHYGR